MKTERMLDFNLTLNVNGLRPSRWDYWETRRSEIDDKLNNQFRDRGIAFHTSVAALDTGDKNAPVLLVAIEGPGLTTPSEQECDAVASEVKRVLDDYSG